MVQGESVESREVEFTPQGGNGGILASVAAQEICFPRYELAGGCADSGLDDGLWPHGLIEGEQEASASFGGGISTEHAEEGCLGFVAGGQATQKADKRGIRGQGEGDAGAAGVEAEGKAFPEQCAEQSGEGALGGIEVEAGGSGGGDLGQEQEGAALAVNEAHGHLPCRGNVAVREQFDPKVFSVWHPESGMGPRWGGLGVQTGVSGCHADPCREHQKFLRGAVKVGRALVTGFGGV